MNMALPSPSAAPAEAAALSGRAAVIAVSAQTILMFALTTLPTPLYPDYAKAFGFDVLTLTLIYATYVAGTLSTLLLLGRLSDQIGRRAVSLSAIALAAVAAVLFLVARGPAMLFAARLVTGIAAGLSSGTAVAWLRELHGKEDARRGMLVSVAANTFGLGLGPLLCGVLVQTGTAPLVLPFAVYIALIAVLAFAIDRTEETVARERSWAELKLRPRIGVPAGKRTAFLAPGVTTFVIYSLTGFYSAIAPGLMASKVHIASHAVASAIVAGYFLVAVAAGLFGARLSARRAMIWGAVLMLPALALLVRVEMSGNVIALLLGTAVGGVSLGLGWRGALEVTGGLADGDKRSEVISMLFVCGNLGMALPVIGIGVLSGAAGSATATLAFAGVIALLSAGGAAFGLWGGRGSGREA
ncbi:MAG TPA: MFS transporter [Rhizomicrobium sp.]|nr:MFS transporter [Rhizomicrobium sp.]